MCFGLHVDKVKRQVGIVTSLSNCVIHGDSEVPQVTQLDGGWGRGVTPWSWAPPALCTDRDPDLRSDALLGQGWTGLPSNLVLRFWEVAGDLPKYSWGLEVGVSTWELDGRKGEDNSTFRCLLQK